MKNNRGVEANHGAIDMCTVFFHFVANARLCEGKN